MAPTARWQHRTIMFHLPVLVLRCGSPIRGDRLLSWSAAVIVAAFSLTAPPFPKAIWRASKRYRRSSISQRIVVIIKHDVEVLFRNGAVQTVLHAAAVLFCNRAIQGRDGRIEPDHFGGVRHAQ